MNAETSVFAICVETIIYLLLYNLHDCTFKRKRTLLDREKLKWVEVKIIKKIYELRMKKFISLLKVIAANSEW